MAYGYFYLVCPPSILPESDIPSRNKQRLKLISFREHENKWPVHNHYADDFVAECEFHDVNAKKRVALLPEALRWFDEDGDLIESDANSDEEGDLEQVGEQPRVDGDRVDDRH